MAGKALIQQAEQKLKPGFLGFLTGGPKFDEACELYQQAANQYKLEKDWHEAAECFKQCAFCSQKSGSPTDQANYLMEAGKLLAKGGSTAQAAEAYEQAISIYNNAGRFGSSAKLLLNMAEMYEQESISHKEAKDYYKRAADMFDMEDNAKSNYTKCMLKVAEFSAKDGEYPEAIRIFETEGGKALQNNLLAFGAKEHYLKAGILHLVMGDSVTVTNKVEEYKSIDPKFAGSREGDLLTGLSEAFQAEDVEAFLDKIADYDKITTIDAWKTEFLLKVKTNMEGGGPGGELDLT